MARHIHRSVEYNRIVPGTVTEESLRILDVLASTYAYEQGLVFTIDHDGLDHRHTSANDYLEHRHGRSTKIEGMERLSPQLWKTCDTIVNGPAARGPFSCHVFIAGLDDSSFPDHTDPDGVFLYVVKGTKTMWVDGIKYVLREDETLYIPPNTAHHAENNYASIMLSIGFDSFMSEKI